ncbi:glycosyl hydrolase family 16 [Winogradskyella litorisediminis]|uniref:Glycosyl hydrolase family 16 n=1 Tax=Winogradskyella litorisediminis TaxID=1156618 RepID=A0ABW3N4I7_9FLAO
MKKSTYILSRITNVIVIAMLFTVSSCERDLSEDAVFATFPNDGDVFIDAFSAGLDYFPFVDAGADPQAFTVETDEVFEGTAAMRFDVPTFGNGFVGATFNTTARRNLTTFDALTFYAKATQVASIDAIGFGIDGETANKYMTTVNGLELTTAWQKFTIPIPNASKLDNETGLFWLAEGASFAGDEGGYTFWIDEVKFENLGTVAQPRPAIFEGQDVVEQAFTGASVQITGLTQTFNLENGENQTVMAAPAYFDFISSDVEVAQISETGEVTVISDGSAFITAQINGVLAEGSLEITSSGGLTAAPTPTQPAAIVQSIFSDAYVEATTSNFTPGFGGSTTVTTITTAGAGNEILSYANNNFTGITFDSTIDASSQSFLHVDVYIQEPTAQIGIQIRDVGANQMIETDVNTGFPIGDDKDFRFNITGLTVGQWTSFDIPLSGDLANQKDNLGALILTDGPNFILDNIYFY